MAITVSTHNNWHEKALSRDEAAVLIADGGAAGAMVRSTKRDKWFLLQEINAWIREQTGDSSDGLTNGQVLPLRDVQTICRAIECFRQKLAESDRSV
jgi:hypothetical protein